MTHVIEVAGLRKEYRHLRRSPTVALDGLDLAVPEGGVYGFLGPNGSGKTTTIRCLLGLVRVTSGRLHMLGRPVPGRLHEVVGSVGSLVESPTFFPNFSGRRNLNLLGRIHRVGRDRVDAALHEVGLAERADDLVKRYSLGMRQRLGIAAALLDDPELLILDEPANGLDPAGIREIRELLRRLGAEGRTVFVSSHILTEVQQMCDRVAILRRGKLVAEGPVGEVLRAGRGAERYVVGTEDPEGAARALREAGLNVETYPDGQVLVAGIPDGGPGEITRLLARRDIWVTELRPEAVNLEDVFLTLTGDGGDGGDGDDGGGVGESPPEAGA